MRCCWCWHSSPSRRWPCWSSTRSNPRSSSGATRLASRPILSSATSARPGTGATTRSRSATAPSIRSPPRSASASSPGLAAYSLSRLNVKGGTLLIAYLFMGITIPPQLYVIPLFSLWVRFDLIDSRIGLIIIYWAIFSPFATLLLRSYMLSLPRELEDASRVDGANELQTLLRIVLPLALPGLLVVALVSFLMSWNEFFFAITFIQSDELKPVTISFLAFQGRFDTTGG